MTDRTDAPKATRREWIGLAVIALPCLLYSMDLTVLNLAVPHLTLALQPSAAQLLWIVDIYGFMVAGFLVTMGTLGDRIGRRKVLLFGAAAFGAASVFAAFASSAATLIFARAALGIAAATLAPSTLSLIRNMFHDPSQRTFAVGIWIASFSAGAALGPLIGGALIAHFWWGSVFLLAVPVMVLLLLVGPFLLPEFRDPKAGRLDPISAVLSLAAVLPAIYGVKSIAASGLSLPPLASIAVGLAMGALFMRRQAKLADPLIDLNLFRIPAFSVSVAANVIGVFAALGCYFLIAQYLQLVLGMAPLEAGLWTAPSGIAFIAGSLAAPALLRRFRPAQVMAGGFAMAALGFAIVSRVESGDLGLLMAGFMLFCVSLAPVGTLTTDLIIGAAPPERAGAASAVAETCGEFGGALGIAVLGSIVTALYRGAMVDAMPPTARETLGNAVTAAGGIPGEAGIALLAVAREAFTHSLTTTAGICAVLALTAAILTSILLRRGHGGAVP